MDIYPAADQRQALRRRLAEGALAVHEAANSPNHPWAKDSASATADALDTLGRVDEAAALRTRYGLSADSAA